MSKLIERLPRDECRKCERLAQEIRDAGTLERFWCVLVILYTHLAKGHEWDVDQIREAILDDA